MGKKTPLRLKPLQATQTVKKPVHINRDRGKDKDTTRHKAVFAFLLLIGLVFLFYSESNNDSELNNAPKHRGKSSSSSFLPFSEDAERYMDRQLQDVAKSTELNALRTELENKKWFSQLELEKNPTQLSPGQKTNKFNNLYQGFAQEIPEDHTSQVYDDISRADIYHHKGSPEARIEALIARRKFIEEYDRAQKVEYVRQFLKNAKDGGYLVKFNHNLEVTQVKKIPTDRPLKLPPSESSSSPKERPSPFDSTYFGSR